MERTNTDKQPSEDDLQTINSIYEKNFITNNDREFSRDDEYIEGISAYDSISWGTSDNNDNVIKTNISLNSEGNATVYKGKINRNVKFDQKDISDTLMLLDEEENGMSCRGLESYLWKQDEKLALVYQLNQLTMRQKMLKWYNYYLQKHCIEVLLESRRMSSLDLDVDELLILKNERYHEKLIEYMQTKEVTKNRKAIIEADLNQIETMYSLHLETWDENCKVVDEYLTNINESKVWKTWNDRDLNIMLSTRKQLLNKLTEIRITELKLQNILNDVLLKLSNSKEESYCNIIDIDEMNQAKIDDYDRQISKFRNEYFRSINALKHVKEMLKFNRVNLKDSEDRLKAITELCEQQRWSMLQQRTKKAAVRKSVRDNLFKLGLLVRPELLKKMKADMNNLIMMKQECSLMKKYQSIK